MKGNRIWVIAVSVFVAVAAAVVAIYVFRNEIAYFFADIKTKIEEKSFKRSGEFVDFVDA